MSFRKYFSGKTGLGIALPLAVVFALLLSLRMALPVWIRHRINGNAGEKGYGWTVRDVDIHVFRAAYDIEGVVLRQKGRLVPTFTAERITSTVRLKTLFHPPVTAEAEAFKPTLDLALDAGPERSEPMDRPDWARLLHRLTLLRLSSFTIHQGKIRFQDKHVHPEVDIYALGVDIKAENLFRGSGDSSRWAGISAQGKLMGQAPFDFQTRIKPEAGSPALKLDLSLSGLELKTMNGALLAYAGLAVAKGRMDLQAHAVASGGGYRGTLQSELHDFAISDSGAKRKGIVKRVVAEVAKVAGIILEKKSERQEEAGKEPPEMDFSGRFPGPVRDSWSASEYLIKSAFRQSLRP
jgi:Domain of Unknown Function (DUF748)